MTCRIAINGFGRIGRLVARALMESGRQDLTLVAINDLGGPRENAHLFRFDSVHGQYPGLVTWGTDALTLGYPGGVARSSGAPKADAHDDAQPTCTVKVLSEPDPKKLPWGSLNIDIVLECSGRFTDAEEAAAHLSAGARRVLISAPSKGADKTIVYGVNQQVLTPQDLLVSNASCTTNCLAPVAAVLHRCVGIRKGFMTTIHAYTGDQRLVDAAHDDLYRARAAAMSMIPTSTGAAKAVGLVLPDLAGKIDGTAVRVPTPNVSLVDFTFESDTPCTVEAINEAIIHAAQEGPLRGILAVNDLHLVSMDFNHNPASSLFDVTQTHVVDGSFVRVLAWYDNEWGFSNRMLDTAAWMGRLV